MFDLQEEKIGNRKKLQISEKENSYPNASMKICAIVGHSKNGGLF